MGHSKEAIRKGVAAEYLAKAHFAKLSYTILDSDTHEKPYDFIIELEGGSFLKVQVKAVNIVETSSGNYARIRNKHGSTNSTYTVNCYDILAGVWVEKNKIYLFHSTEVNQNGFSECINLERVDNRPLDRKRRPEPYFVGDI